MTPLLWPMENGEWRIGIACVLACGENFLIRHALFVVWIILLKLLWEVSYVHACVIRFERG